MSISVNRQMLDGVAVLEIEGRLVGASVNEARQSINSLIADNVLCLVVDLSGVRFVDSSGLGMLVASLRAAAAKGGDVKLAGPTSEVRALLSLTRLDRVFDIHREPDTAVERFAEALQEE
jgi:anti-sigma B factor antagonist